LKNYSLPFSLKEEGSSGLARRVAPKGLELKKKKCNEEVESTKEALADPHIQQTMCQEKCRSYSPMKFTL
jgi:hypothetical protein